MNVIMGERYKTFPKESKAMLRGEYGKLPGEVNEEVRAKAGIKPEDIITCRPADNLEPELEKFREEYKDLARSEEDVLSLALFPQVAPKFLDKRNHNARKVVNWSAGIHNTDPVKAPEYEAFATRANVAARAQAQQTKSEDEVRELYVEYKF